MKALSKTIGMGFIFTVGMLVVAVIGIVILMLPVIVCYLVNPQILFQSPPHPDGWMWGIFMFTWVVILAGVSVHYDIL